MTSFPQKNAAEAGEDCRDYLRTGRCKYGASCKFNHPPNVQSGGGIKAPIDPSEPLFPVRVNEPVCQYYMKHGTCKFSQACKFHHPPQSSVQATTIVGSSTIFIPRANESQHIVLNNVGQDQASSAMMLQFLPQRPDEPDCLYFLRNGTCKYGATCRYHHPVNHQQQRKSMDAQRRPQQQVVQIQNHISGEGMVQYIQTQSGYQQQSSRVVSTSGGQHVLVTETPIQVMSMNGGSYQQIAVDDYGSSGGATLGLSQHHASPSSSSIASSYETSSSNLEYIAQGQGSWDRPKRSNSGGSLSAFADAQQARQQAVPGPNRVLVGNDNSLQSRRLRAASFGSMGSTSDQSGYHEGVIGWSGGNGSQNSLRLHQERFAEGNSSEHARRQYHYTVREENPLQRQPHDQVRNVIPRQGPPRQNRVGNVDQGLSMMTSALLNMLDTPEEAAARSYPSRISSSSTLNNGTSPPTTPRSGNIQSPQLTSVSLLHEHRVPLSASSPNLYQQGQQMFYSTQFSSEHPVRLEPSRSALYQPAPPKHQDPSYAYNDCSDHFLDSVSSSDHHDHDWSPSWQELSNHQGGQNAQGKSALQHSQSNGPSSPLSNIGLYLP